MKDEIEPTEKTLELIEKWPLSASEDLHELLAFVKDYWWNAEWGWTQKGNVFWISTGGWSDNEALIGALRCNRIFWSLCWFSSRRGGHYRFRIPKIKKEKIKPRTFGGILR